MRRRHPGIRGPAETTEAAAAPPSRATAERRVQDIFGDKRLRHRAHDEAKPSTGGRNMAGETVHGTYTQTGPEIEIHWIPRYYETEGARSSASSDGPLLDGATSASIA